jgi:3-oxoacid CoA-transferase subunit A
MIYITGDTHGNFERVEEFCKRFKTSREDILIILGDAGINFSGPKYDRVKKKLLEELPITIFAIHGNHEQRPYTIESYKEKIWNGGTVYQEEEFPHILFAKDGEIFHLDGKKTVVMGGAYSIDKARRLARGYGWWEDEQPSEEIKQYVKEQLSATNWEVDVVLSHTTPLKYEPVELFMAGVNQSKVDKSTEIWLDKIEDRLSYKKWYCGHYHTEKKIDRLEIMFENFEEFSIDYDAIKQPDADNPERD